MPTRLTKMQIQRISLVDRPAHPDAEVVIAKRDDQESLTENTSKFVEYDNIQASTTQTQSEVVMAKYTESDMEMDEEMADEAEAPAAGKKGKKMPKELLARFEAMGKSEDIELDPEDDDDEVAATDIDDVIKSLPSDAVDYIEKLEDVVFELQERLTKSETALLEVVADDDDDDLLLVVDDDDEITLAADEAEDGDLGLEKFLKSADPRLATIVKSLADRADAAEKIAKRERDLRLEKEYIAKADSLSALPAKRTEIVALLKAVNESAPHAAGAFEELLKRCNGALAESGIFKSEGQEETGSASTIVAKWDNAIEAIRKGDSNLSYEQAFAVALDKHPEIYDEYLNGKR